MNDKENAGLNLDSGYIADSSDTDTDIGSESEPDEKIVIIFPPPSTKPVISLRVRHNIVTNRVFRPKFTHDSADRLRKLAVTADLSKRVRAWNSTAESRASMKSERFQTLIREWTGSKPKTSITFSQK